MAETTAGATVQAAGRTGYFRWVVCALLFFGTTVNYIDRQVLGLLAPELRHVIGWNDVQYGYIVTAFSGAYALGLLLTGRVLDTIGTKLGYAVALVFWSRVVPTASRIIVVRASVYDAVVNEVMRQMRVVGIAVERKLKHAHARQMKLVSQRRDRRCDDTEILGKQWEPTESLANFFEEVGAGTRSLFP